MDYTYMVLDDEEIILDGMAETLRNIVGNKTMIYKASDPIAALEQLKLHHIDIIFTDIDMPGMNGIKFANRASEINEDVELVFTTGYAHYALDAWNTSARGFILKPVSNEDMNTILHRIWSNRERYDLTSDGKDYAKGKSSQKKCRLEAKCFGSFELFYDGVPVHFCRKKSKEMVAFLIDRRGSMISTGEIRSVLWEDGLDSEEKKGYIRVLANDIRKSLEDVGVSDFLRNDMDCYGVNITEFSCDYYQLLEGDERARNYFGEEYMNQYTWAESTLGSLMQIV